MTDRRQDGSFDITGSSSFEQVAAGVNQYDTFHSAHQKVLDAQRAQNSMLINPTSNSTLVNQNPTGLKLDDAISKFFLWWLLIPVGSTVILAVLAYATHSTLLGLVQSYELGRHPSGIAAKAAQSVLNGQPLQSPDVYLTNAQIARALSASALLKIMDGNKAPDFRFGLDHSEPVRASAYLCAFNEDCRAVVDQHGRHSLDHVLRLAQQFLLLQVVKGRGGQQAVRDYCFFPLAIEPRIHNVGNARDQCASLVAVLKPPGLAVGQQALSEMDASLWLWMSRGLALGSKIYGVGYFHF